MRIVPTFLRHGGLVRTVAPRVSASRFLQTGLLKNSSSSSLQQQLAATGNNMLLTVRSFSAQTDLLDILSREEQEEVDSGNMKLPQELASLKSTLEKDWRIVDNGGAMTQLFLKNKKVQVSFHCQDTIENIEDMAGSEEFMEEDDEEEEEPAQSVRFTVTVSKAGKTLVVNCLSEFGEGKIEGVTTTSASADVVHANQGVVEKGDYQGPDFLELAEDLQEAFGLYFEEECGITSDVAAFVAMYTDYKEQLQYVQFLKDAQSIIS